MKGHYSSEQLEKDPLLRCDTCSILSLLIFGPDIPGDLLNQKNISLDMKRFIHAQ